MFRKRVKKMKRAAHSMRHAFQRHYNYSGEKEKSAGRDNGDNATSQCQEVPMSD